MGKKKYKDVTNMENELHIKPEEFEIIKYSEVKKAWNRLDEFLNLFPFRDHPEKIDELTAEKIYTAGDKNTFFYWPEFGLKNLGRVGSYSAFYAESARDNAEKFKELLKKAVDDSLSLSYKIEPWEDIKWFGGDRIIAKKIIFCYYPKDIIPIFSTKDLEHFANIFELNFEIVAFVRYTKSYDMLSVGQKFELLNNFLLNVKNNKPEFKRWDNLLFMKFLYENFQPERIGTTAREIKPLLDEIKKLENFIKNNPPVNTFWSSSDWKEKLFESIPGWKELLENPEVWKKIKGINPRRYYDSLLEVILPYAPDSILIEYLKSPDEIERKEGFGVLIKDNGRRLTADFWKSLDEDMRICIISNIIGKIQERGPKFVRDLDIFLHDPQHFFERLERREYLQYTFPNLFPFALAELVFYEDIDSYSLWVNLKATVKQCNDLLSMKKIEEYEQKIKDKFQRIIELLKPCQHPFVSKNVMFDPSILLDSEKAQKTFNFMRENSKEFNFFISRQFYNFLKEYGENHKQMITGFFGYEKEISPGKLLGMIEEHGEYFTFFEVPNEVYVKKYSYFYENLLTEVENKQLIKILFEEWVFLQEFSWIVAKSKNIFEKFKESGAVVVEFSEKAVDKIVKKTLKKQDDDFITTFDRLSALGKWIAVGGSSATSFLSPSVGTLIGFSTGIFLLLDPDDAFGMEAKNGDGV
jgi:hypothetical protein